MELLLSSGKTINQVATELGLGHDTLDRWKSQYLDRSSLQRDGQRITAADLEKEVHRLRVENEHLRRQRDILKKSLGILSEEPLQKGMRPHENSGRAISCVRSLCSVERLPQRLLRLASTPSK